MDEVKMTIRFPGAVALALRQLAVEHRRSLSGEIVWALQQYVQQEKEKREHDGQHS